MVVSLLFFPSIFGVNDVANRATFRYGFHARGQEHGHIMERCGTWQCRGAGVYHDSWCTGYRPTGTGQYRKV